MVKSARCLFALFMQETRGRKHHPETYMIDGFGLSGDIVIKLETPKSPTAYVTMNIWIREFTILIALKIIFA